VVHSWRSPIQSRILEKNIFLPNLAHSSCGGLPIHLFDKIEKEKKKKHMFSCCHFSFKNNLKMEKDM
jgi:hypothetical protein